MIDHRFLGIQEFLQDLLPFKDVLQANFNARLMFGGDVPAGCEGESGKAKKKESYIDSKLVVAALVSTEWWSYAEMLLAVGSVPQELVYMSRRCVCCAPPEKLQNYFSSKLFQRLSWRRNVWSTHLQSACPGKGFNVAWFAVGKGRKLVEDLCTSLRHQLLSWSSTQL